MIVNKIPKGFLEKLWWIQNQIQWNHWKESNSGWRHKVLGDYYKEIANHIDNLVEGVAGKFTRNQLIISDSMYAIQEDLDHIKLISQINILIIDFRSSLLSENGIINIIDAILELNDTTMYKLELN